jgi:hypothetical protein
MVNDPEVDKSKTLMMQDVLHDDLIIGYKIDNQDVWENFVKTGKVDGLSVEAFLDYEITNPIKMNTEEKKTFIEELKEVFKSMFMAVPSEKTEEELAAEKLALDGAGDPAPDPMAELQAKYDSVMAENADLKEQLSVMQVKKVEDDTKLETMKTQIETFKADAIAIKNLPNEKVKTYAEMNNYEKMQFNKNK